MISISSQAIDASPYQEMRSNLLSRAKQFIDVALYGRRYGCSVPDRREVQWTVLSSPAIGCSLSSRWGPAFGLIFLLSAAVPLNLSFEVQNFTAHNPQR